MDQGLRQALDDFFRATEQRAYLMAMALTHDRQDALELVQESMLRLVQKYRHREPDEWGPLFYRILQNSIRDWFRRQKFRQVLAGLLPWQAGGSAREPQQASAEDEALRDAELERVFAALEQLPLRQQQTFLMRAWQEFSTRETAFALSISENSVKTHYARATRQLQRVLGDDDE